LDFLYHKANPLLVTRDINKEMFENTNKVDPTLMLQKERETKLSGHQVCLFEAAARFSHSNYPAIMLCLY
jgi:hypothetical protein